MNGRYSEVKVRMITLSIIRSKSHVIITVDLYLKVFCEGKQ